MSNRTKDVWSVLRGSVFLFLMCLVLPAVLLGHVASVLAA